MDSEWRMHSEEVESVKFPRAHQLKDAWTDGAPKFSGRRRQRKASDNSSEQELDVETLIKEINRKHFDLTKKCATFSAYNEISNFQIGNLIY